MIGTKYVRDSTPDPGDRQAKN